ncbi:poly(A) polymerase [Polymorphobacter glacialis]|uniref:Poly(A) polymerase n=1 Tax=Sandarakinorhabdus glacialis TaxID=1614636 RepID=A0A917E4Z9_9SPHN|nr:CCA tRNA nucleotidyltransferase [Polymorphobacter glacialis]GGE01450.1 poly(A) polymerase [Polymorphobacter glacialis]
MNWPQQDWVVSPAGTALLEALGAAAGETRLVGGIVRDGLLDLPGSDIDLATRLAPREVMRRLSAAGLKAVPTGIAHGTVTAISDGLVAEVTTLRRDVVTDGRHAEVAFTDDWQEDASRRDFTINALYAALPAGEISDFFGGLDDLAARRVRFIGAPLARIAEDHLRILRFFRFSARFGGVIDAEGLAACTARANDLMALSRERISAELRGILSVPDPVAIIGLMIDQGIFRPVLPEITAARLPVLARTVAAEAAAGVAPDWRRRLAALLPADAAAVVASRLRLSNADKVRLVAAAVPHGGGAIYPQAWTLGAETLTDRLLIAGEQGAEVIALISWTRPKMPASGRDLLARGLPPGPEVARRLGLFERAWVAAGFPQDTATVTALLDRAVAGPEIG